MSQRWVEVAFTVPEASAEEWSAALLDAGVTGIEERDVSTLQPPGAGLTTLVVWVDPGEVEVLLQAARSAGAGLPEAQISRRDRDEDEWRDAWKKHFSARKIGRFVIVPSWEQYQPADDEVVLDLDPGRAFGTGGHASTRLCLGALGQVAPPARFLDVGTGSGVLAIAAARAWPEARGVAIDVDADAVEVSRENAARNGVADRVEVSTAALGTIEGPFDLIMANIQPEVLVPMAGALTWLLAPAGRLILSGILIEAAPPVEDAYRAAGLRVVRRLDEDGWRALVLARPESG